MDKNLITIHLRPLPSLQPLQPSQGMINLFQDQAHPSLSLSAVPEEQHEDEQTNSFKELYEEKCEEEASLKSKMRNHEEIIKILQEKNSSLQAEVNRLQEQRWKKFDYSKLSARGRSKSQKKMAPTIDVKVPHRMNKNQEKFIKTDRDSYNEDISYYKQEVREYREENKRLKEQIQRLTSLIKEITTFKGGSLPNDNNVARSRSSKSPQKSEWAQFNASTPMVSPFSPFPKQSSQTVKKQGNAYDELAQQLKKMKSEVLYKDLLLDKLRAEHARQCQVLRKHLTLSVTQSQNIADQTTSIFNSFKAEIIRLTQELQQYKKRVPSLLLQNKNQCTQNPCNQKELLAILKARRAQKITQ